VATGFGWPVSLLSHEASVPKNHTRFPLSPRQTVREVFPHTAFLWEFRDKSHLVSSEVAELFGRFKLSAMRPSFSSFETPTAGVLPSVGVMLSPTSSVL
jgi:hypothetical protein